MVQLLRLLGPYIVWLYPLGIIVLIVYLRSWLMSSRDLRASLFTLEREAAVRRMRRAATAAFCVFGALVALFCTQFFLARSVDWDTIIRPTPTPEFGATAAYVPTPAPGTPTTPTTPDPRTPSPTPRVTPTRRPTVRWVEPTTAPTPTPMPPALPASCSTPGVQIVQPSQGAFVSGRVDIRGTADIANFSFYKVELGLGEQPGRWTAIGDLHRAPVTDGFLDVLDTSGLPPGTYSIRLVVVDVTGNFPEPCEVQIVVTH